MKGLEAKFFVKLPSGIIQGVDLNGKNRHLVRNKEDALQSIQKQSFPQSFSLNALVHCKFANQS